MSERQQALDAKTRQDAETVLYQYMDDNVSFTDDAELVVTGDKETIPHDALVAVYELKGFKRMRVKTTHTLVND